MDWTKAYPPDIQPTERQIAEFIENPLWEKLNTFLSKSYEVEPKYSYSSCSGQPGWNVKYQKAGKSLCTLYPLRGFFIALVVVGSREQTEAQLLLPTFSAHVQDLMKTAAGMAGASWLMIQVTDEQILGDVMQLILLRRKPVTAENIK